MSCLWEIRRRYVKTLAGFSRLVFISYLTLIVDRMDQTENVYSEYLHTQIEIKDEPMDLHDFYVQIKEEPLDQHDFYAQEEEQWSLESVDFTAVKEETESTNEEVSHPVVAGDAHPSEMDDKDSQPPFIFKNVQVESRERRKNSCQRALLRAMETKEQREERLRKDRERHARQRAAEKSIAEVYQQRLKEDRERVAQTRSRWTAQQREENLRKGRLHKRMKRLELKVGTLIDTSANISLHMEKGKYVCNMCDFVVESEVPFREHYLNHFNNTCFSCSYCSEKFYYKYDLLKHEFSHCNGKEPSKCKLCLSEHLSWQTFLKCRRKHKTITKCSQLEFEGPEPFCHRKAKKLNFETHYRETQIKTPILCEVCGRMVSTLKKFQNHQRTHTGDKPCICEECGKNFRTSMGLYLHTRRIHSKKKS